MDSYQDRINSYKNESNERWINIALVLLGILTVIAILRFAFFENVLVVKTSMSPTIYDGQTVTILKTKNVSRGDIVVFKDTDVYDEVLIKRVIGIENDILSIDSDGILRISYKNKDNTVTHKAIVEPYIKDGENIIVQELTVPEGCLYVLGDNRIISYDSSEFGSIREESIIGKVVKFGK